MPLEGGRRGAHLGHTVTEVAARYGAGPHIATKVLDDALVTATYLPETLCIDEFRANTGHGRFAVAVTDGSEGTLCEALRDKKRKTPGPRFPGFGKAERERVRCFCCDTYGPFVSAAKRWLPNAVVCIDRFHVVKTAAEAVGNVRRRVQGRKDLDAADAKEVKGSRRLLIMRRADLEEPGGRYAADPAEKRARYQATLLVEDEDLNRVPGLRAREPRCKVLERVLGRDEALGTAYGLMQDFFWWSDSKWSRRKRQGLYEWCNKAAAGGGRPVHQAVGHGVGEVRGGVWADVGDGRGHVRPAPAAFRAAQPGRLHLQGERPGLHREAGDVSSRRSRPRGPGPTSRAPAVRLPAGARPCDAGLALAAPPGAVALGRVRRLPGARFRHRGRPSSLHASALASASASHRAPARAQRRAAPGMPLLGAVRLRFSGDLAGRAYGRVRSEVPKPPPSDRDGRSVDGGEAVASLAGTHARTRSRFREGQARGSRDLPRSAICAPGFAGGGPTGRRRRPRRLPGGPIVGDGPHGKFRSSESIGEASEKAGGEGNNL